MFEILTGSAESGGTLAFQKDTLERAKQNLSEQLNSRKDVKVHAFSVYQEDSGVQIIAVVESSSDKTNKRK